MWTRTYLFLKSEGDTSDGSLLDSLHQVGREAGDLVSESLGLDRTDVINDSLIYMEVVGQPANRHAQLAQLCSAERWIKTVRFGAFPLSATTYFP